MNPPIQPAVRGFFYATTTVIAFQNRMKTYTLTIRNGELTDAQRQQLHAIVTLMTQRTATLTEDATPAQPAPATEANAHQVGGDHYTDMAVQPWDVLQHWLTPEEYRGYQKGVAITYLARERQKGGDTDISKAAHHLQKLVEVLGNKNVSVKVGIDNAPQCLTITDEWIDQVIASIPGGMNGFLKTWGLQQFARAVVDAHRDPAPTPAPTEAPSADADGWIEWHGGECPVPPDTMVQWKLRGWPEEIIGPERAGDRFWKHRSSSGDIIAYRVGRTPEVCCGNHATCTKPCVPRVQLHADADGWIQHDGSNVCPVPPDVIVTACSTALPEHKFTTHARALNWVSVGLYKISESK